MKVISFDLDGTLVTDAFSRNVWHQGMPELYAQQYGCSYEEAHTLLLGEYNRVGDDALEWYDIRHWFGRLQLRGHWKNLLGAFIHHISTYPEVHEVLDRLSSRHRLMITSNAAREFLDMELEVAGIAPYFHHVVSATSDYRQVKKSAAFYRMLCERLDLRTCDLVHVGDHYRFDYLAPGELGIRSFYLDRSGGNDGPFMVKDLREFTRKLND